MSKTRKEDISQMTAEDLGRKIADETDTLRKLRFNHAVTPLDNPLLLRTYRREIARLKTELRNREIASANN